MDNLRYKRLVKRNKTQTTYLSDEEKEKLRLIAEYEGYNCSVVIRRFILRRAGQIQTTAENDRAIWFQQEEKYEPYQELIGAIFGDRWLKLSDCDRVVEIIDRALDSLSERQKEVIKMRYGFYGSLRTLEAVGQEFGVTRERIRQVEARALRILRHPFRSKRIREYLESGIGLGATTEETREMQATIEALTDQVRILKERLGHISRLYEVATKHRHKLLEDGKIGPGHPLSGLDLPVRAYNALKRAGVETIEEVVLALDRDGGEQLLYIRNFGEKSLKDLKAALEKWGYKWGDLA